MRRLHWFPSSQSRSRQQGFTLVEIICALVLVALLAILAGQGMATAGKSVMLTRDSVDLAQRAEIIMARLSRELTELKDVSSNSGGVTIFTGSEGDRALAYIGTALHLAESGSSNGVNDPLLAEGVTAFSVSLLKSGGTSSTAWTPGSDDANELVAVDVNMTLKAPQSGAEHQFSRRIIPRNNGNMGGANPSTATGKYSNCLITVAAPRGPGGPGLSGGNDQHHPAQVLRRFRDQYLYSSESGRAIAALYAQISPYLADIIRERPTLRALVWQGTRLTAALLEPAMNLAEQRAALPVPGLLIAMLCILLALYVLKRRQNYFIRDISMCFIQLLRSGPRRSCEGSVLLVAIIVIVAFSALAGGILSLMSSGSISNVTAQRGDQAYYMAESGFNVLSGLYKSLNTKAEQKNLLKESDGRTYTLTGNEGSFTYNITPYWFDIVNDTGNRLVLETPGSMPGFPSSMTGLSDVLVRIGKDDNFRPVQSILKNGGQLEINSSGSHITAATGDEAFLTAKLNGSQTLGDTITLPADAAALFPEVNGAFSLYDPALPASPFNGSVIFSYGKRVGDELQNVRWSSGSGVNAGLAVPADTYLTLEPYVQVAVLGSTKDGITRSLTFYMPVSGGSSSKPDTLTKETIDTSLVSGKGWDDPPVQVTDGLYSGSWDSRWKPTLTTALAGSYNAALNGEMCLTASVKESENFAMSIFNNPIYNSTMLKQFQDTGGYLSYDVQMKLKPMTERYILGPLVRVKKNARTTGSAAYKMDFVAVSLMRVTGASLATNGTVGSEDAPPSMWMINQAAYQGFIPGITPGTTYSTLGSYPTWGPLFQYPGGGLRDLPMLSQKMVYTVSLPAIVLWEQRDGVRRWLAYKLLTETANTGLRSGSDSGASIYIFGKKDAITTSEWNTLVVRVTEGDLSEFSGGHQRVKHGTKVANSSGDKSAFITGQPIITGDPYWRNARGFLTLGIPGLNGDLPEGGLYVNNAQAINSSAHKADKGVYVRVYYASKIANGNPPGYNPVDENRGAKPLGNKEFMPDDYSEWVPSTDNFTLLQWDVVNTAVVASGLGNPGPAASTAELFSLTSPALVPAARPTIIKLHPSFNSPAPGSNVTAEELPIRFGIVSYGDVCVADYSMQYDHFTRGSLGSSGGIPPVRD